jgi:hypothetical protein
MQKSTFYIDVFIAVTPKKQRGNADALELGLNGIDF